MNTTEKYERIFDLKKRLNALPIRSDEYKLIVNDTESFVAHAFDKETADKWLKKIKSIHWLPRVFTTGPYNDVLLEDAWVEGREQFNVLFSSIENELSYEDVYEESFSSALMKIFASYLKSTTEKLISIYPRSHESISSIDKNLKSSNSEDWANAVTSCRRLLKFTADALYPPTEPKEIGGKIRKLDDESYKNRLLAYISEKVTSKTNSSVLMNDLEKTATEMDSIYESVCKGVHDIISLKEAEMYVVHTIIIIGEILTI